MATRYRVYFTPRSTLTEYGDEIEVTDYVLSTGIKTINTSIDSEDYDVGTFTYDDLEIKASNQNGFFNEPEDLRSIFLLSRDLTQVKVQYENDVTGDSIVYRGLINEEATKLDASNEVISFRILSRDSVLRNTKIAGGVISDGMSFTNAFLAIFSDPKISAVLSLDAGDISLPFDGVVDDGTFFSGKNSRDGLNALLIASGAVILIDDDANVTIRDRSQNETEAVLNLYGPYDIHRRQNIISLKEYNSGLHRMYTSVIVNDTEVNDSDYVETFGYRTKSFDLGFITDPTQIEEIAMTILTEFKSPKKECQVEVPISVARNINLLDPVSVNWPLRITPYATNLFLPIIGVTKIGDTEMPLPRTYGSLYIDPEVAFKVIEVQEDPSKFIAILKLRQIGNSLEDGYFVDASFGIIGLSKIGVAIIMGAGDPESMFDVSAVGAAKIGSTELV